MVSFLCFSGPITFGLTACFRHETQEIAGLRLDTCTNTVFRGAYDTFEIPDPGLFAPAGGDQTANVVITGDSSGIIFRNMPIGPNTGMYERDGDIVSTQRLQ